MRVLIVGAGAVGSVLGARLARAGHQVTLVARPAHARAIATHGLHIEGTGAGTFHLPAVTAVPEKERFDLAILATKTFDLGSAASELGRALPPLPTLLVQNGLGVEATTLEALRHAGWPRPEGLVVRAVQSIPATFLREGRVRSTGMGEVVLPEPGSAGTDAEAVRRFLELFERSGIVVRSTPDLPREVWKKLLVNAAINPVTAIHLVPNGELAGEPLRREALALLEEARRLAERVGVRFSSEEAVAELERVVRATAQNRSSMLQDVERGRPTEIDAISGEILRRGRELGLALPATEAAVRALSRPGRRGPQPL